MRPSVFTKSFTSDALTLMDNSQFTVTHGLGALPLLITARLVNVNDPSFQPGHVLYLYDIYKFGAGDVFYGIDYADFTSTTIQVYTNKMVYRKGTIPQFLQMASWNLFVSCYA
jgi:hypothetical protein